MTEPIDLAPAWPIDWFRSSIEYASTVWVADDFRATAEAWLGAMPAERCIPWMMFACEAHANAPEVPQPSEYQRDFVAVQKLALDLIAKLRAIDQQASSPVDSKVKGSAFLYALSIMKDSMGGWDEMLTLRTGLADLAEGAESAACHLEINAASLNTGAGSRNRGLSSFVLILAALWKSVTGRTATAEKKRSGDDPDFYLFVHAVAKATQARDRKIRPPTRSQVKTALA